MLDWYASVRKLVLNGRYGTGDSLKENLTIFVQAKKITQEQMDSLLAEQPGASAPTYEELLQVYHSVVGD